MTPKEHFLRSGCSLEAIQKAKQCLADNGVEADETEIVLEALGYILFDADITKRAEEKS